MLAVVLPSQIASIVGPDRKEFTSGVILGIGAGLSLFVTPIAGALSERVRGRVVRRVPFMRLGTALNALCLLALARFGAGSAVSGFLFVYLLVQLGSNFAGGPYARLVHDRGPRDQQR